MKIVPLKTYLILVIIDELPIEPIANILQFEKDAVICAAGGGRRPQHLGPRECRFNAPRHYYAEFDGIEILPRISVHKKRHSFYGR
jgi:hypothetical protein